MLCVPTRLYRHKTPERLEGGNTRLGWDVHTGKGTVCDVVGARDCIEEPVDEAEASLLVECRSLFLYIVAWRLVIANEVAVGAVVLSKKMGL